MITHLFPLTLSLFFFFFNDTATTEIYTLSLHDALPICGRFRRAADAGQLDHAPRGYSHLEKRLDDALGNRVVAAAGAQRDRKSTRLNSSHGYISYAVFCLKKKKQT